MTSWTKRLPMPIASHPGAGPDDDIFLNMLRGFLHGRQILGVAMGADGRSRHMNAPVQMARVGSHPSRMSYGHPALFLFLPVGQRDLLVLLFGRLCVFFLI